LTRHYYAAKITQLNLADAATGVSPVQPGGDARRSIGKLGSTRHPFDVIPNGEQSFGLASFDLIPVRLHSGST